MADPDLQRLESKVDKLTDAVMRLVVIEERQSAQGERIGKAEQRISAVETASTKTDRKVDMWVNRGIGVWAVAVLIFTVVPGVAGLVLMALTPWMKKKMHGVH